MTRKERREEAANKRRFYAEHLVTMFTLSLNKTNNVNKAIDYMASTYNEMLKAEPQQKSLLDEALTQATNQIAPIAGPLLAEERRKKAEADKVYLQTLYMLGSCMTKK